MKVQPLQIGELKAKLPLIQGGMGVGISLSGLAGAVAKAGGVGLISTAQIGWREPDFDRDPLGANLRALAKELKKARKIAPDGVLGFNIMVATRKYGEYVKAAAAAGADLIVSGAGLPVDLPKFAAGFSTKLAPIVSSSKAANLICKLWDRRYETAPDLVVVEGPEAGGHLGFSEEDAKHLPKKNPFEEEIQKILEAVPGLCGEVPEKDPGGGGRRHLQQRGRASRHGGSGGRRRAGGHPVCDHRGVRCAGGF